jgi:methylglutaconyl-CoA hydratase
MDQAAPATRLEVAQGVATITLDRPERRNALSSDLVASLLGHLTDAIAEPAVRVIVITGAGTVFCAGADLRERSEPGTAGGPPTFVRVFEAIADAPKPVIARVQGPALAGGLGLACACDISIAVDTATFGFTEVRIGVAPAIISVVVLPRLRATDASELFLGGERISAQRAVEVGLINDAVPADRLDAAVAEWCDRLRLGGPGALAATKRLLRHASHDYAAMAQLSAQLFASDEGQEGMTAFKDKRPPAWAR